MKIERDICDIERFAFKGNSGNPDNWNAIKQVFIKDSQVLMGISDETLRMEIGTDEPKKYNDNPSV